MERFIPDTLVLPNNKLDLLVPQNEKSSGGIFNSKLSKLNENFDYLLSMGSLNLPLSASEYTPYSDLFLTIEPSNIINSQDSSYDMASPLNNIDIQMAVHKEYIRSNVKYNILCLFNQTTQTIDIYRAEEYQEVNLELRYRAEYEYITSYSKVKQNGNLPYKNITGLSLSDDGYLFIVDTELELILKYDLNDLILKTPQISTKQRLLTIENGNIQNTSVNNFTPTYLKIFDNKIYTLNIFNSRIYVYDTNLKFIKYVEVNIVESMEYVDIGIDSNENIYILYKKGYCTKYSNTGTLIDTGFLEDPIGVNRTFQKIEFDYTNPDVFIVSTERSVFKKNVERFTSPIGAFDYSLIEPELKNAEYYKDIYISNGNLYILSIKGINIIPIKQYYEYLYQTQFIGDFFNINPVEDDEFEQDFVYNEKFKKIIYNHMLYYHIISRKPVINYTERGDEVFGGFTSPIKKDIDINSYYVGINEVFSSSVFNRCIENIYNLQEEIISVLSAKKLIKDPVTLKL